MPASIIVKIKSFFKLIRWFHELLAVLPFIGLYLVINYFAEQEGVICDLSAFNLAILCFCVQLLVAAGCVLNDIQDRHIDKVNKPRTHIVGNTISLTGAKTIFISISILIVVFTVYISRHVFKEWAYIAVGVYLLSILYDVYLKRAPLFGNILMALLTSFVPLVILFFAKDCIALLNNDKIITLVYLYAGFPFLVVIPRELSLDISDIEGDRENGCKTLPIILGIKKSRMLVVLFLLMIIILSVPIAVANFYLLIPIISVDILLIFYMILLKNTHIRIEYIRIGRFLWFIMISGLVGFTVATIL